jgi:hypothetical protein
MAHAASFSPRNSVVVALDQIHNLLREVELKRLNSGMVYDSTGQLRLVCRTPNWGDFVELAVTDIRQFGAHSTHVSRRLRAMLEALITQLLPQRASTLQLEVDPLRIRLITPSSWHRTDSGQTCQTFRVCEEDTRTLTPQNAGLDQ